MRTNSSWIDFAPDDPELEEFGVRHGWHPLHLEDCRSDEQQAKLELGNGYLFLVLKLVLLTEEELETADLDVFLGDDYLAIVHKSPVPVIGTVTQNASDLAMPPGKQLYRILDAVVDSYLPVLEAVELRIDTLEDLVIRRPDPGILENIADILSILLDLRRVLANTRRVTNLLRRADGPLLMPELQPFFTDVHDHLERDLGSSAAERERLKGLLDIYHSNLASRNNEATRMLTVMGTVSLPAVVIASFLGMSLRYPSWMNWPGTILVVSGVILLITGGLLLFLKKRNYL